MGSLRYFIPKEGIIHYFIGRGLISGLLTSVGKTSWETLISKGPTKFVVKTSVNS